MEVVRYAREKGYSLSAFVYRESSKKFLPSDVKIIQGDIINYQDVHKALNGTEAIISVVGHIKGSAPLMQTKGMQNIVNAMKAHKLSRVLSLTGTGVRMVGDRPSIVDRILNIAVSIVDPERVNDGIEHVKVLQNSNLDWTVVRILKLTKSTKPLKSYALTEGGPVELFTSRKKVAQVLINLIDDKKYIGKMPVISG